MIVRNAGEDLPVGEAEIVEVAATGDTIWRRRLEFGPVRLTRQMLEAELHWFVEGVSAFVEESPAGNGGQSAAGLIEEALWGVWKDELDINYVVGRRLVPPA